MLPVVRSQQRLPDPPPYSLRHAARGLPARAVHLPATAFGKAVRSGPAGTPIGQPLWGARGPR